MLRGFYSCRLVKTTSNDEIQSSLYKGAEILAQQQMMKDNEEDDEELDDMIMSSSRKVLNFQDDALDDMVGDAFDQDNYEQFKRDHPELISHSEQENAIGTLDELDEEDQ